jgi:hypothetical protein
MTSEPIPATCAAVKPFTVAAVPTGINAGVRMIPRGVTSRPLRAAPQRASI